MRAWIVSLFPFSSILKKVDRCAGADTFLNCAAQKKHDVVGAAAAQMKAGKTHLFNGQKCIVSGLARKLIVCFKGLIEPLPLCDEVTRGSDERKRAFIVVTLRFNASASQPKGLQSFD